MHDQIQCNRVSVRTQGTVKLVAIRRLHCTCYIVSVALCLLYNVCCIAFVVLCVLLLCLLHCVCCIASRSKRSQVIGSTGLGGANSALRLLLPMSSSSAILHSISLKLQQTSRAAGLFLIDGRVSCKPNEGGGNVFLLGIRAQERCHRAYRGRRLPKILPGNAIIP